MKVDKFIDQINLKQNKIRIYSEKELNNKKELNN
jgi:hypothetical protein